MYPAPRTEPVVHLVVLPVVAAEVALPSSVFNVVCLRSGINYRVVLGSAFVRVAAPVSAAAVRAFAGVVCSCLHGSIRINQLCLTRRLLRLLRCRDLRPDQAINVVRHPKRPLPALDRPWRASSFDRAIPHCSPVPCARQDGLERKQFGHPCGSCRERI